MSIISRITDWVTTPYTIYLILKDRTIPKSEKVRSIIGLILIFAYVVSPIDLIPDFIPFAGWLDDLIVIPLGLALMRKFIPSIIVLEKKERAQASVRQIVIWTAVSLVIVVFLGILILGLLIYAVVRLLTG
jgi:uncharacterized membrane protein YkvA (DUF1232 family)